MNGNALKEFFRAGDLAGPVDPPGHTEHNTYSEVDRMFEKVRAIIADQLNVDAEKITMESSIIEDLGADSLDVVELIMALEENFGVEIPDDDAEKINTIGDIVNYIENH